MRALANHNSAASDFGASRPRFSRWSPAKAACRALRDWRGRRHVPARRPSVGLRSRRADERQIQRECVGPRWRPSLKSAGLKRVSDRRPHRLSPGAGESCRAHQRVHGNDRDQRAARLACVTPFDAVHHMALVYGRVGDGKNMLTRLHRANLLRDIFGGAPMVHEALRRFGKGVACLCSCAMARLVCRCRNCRRTASRRRRRFIAVRGARSDWARSV